MAESLIDLVNVRSLLLQRVSSAQIKDVDIVFAQIAEDIEKALSASKPLTEEGFRRVNAIIRDLQAMVSLKAPDLSELAQIEAEATVNNLAAVSIEARLPPLSVIEKIASSSLIEGAVISEWFSSIEKQTQFDISRTVRAGIAAGRTNYQIGKDIVGLTVDKQLGKEALKKARRDAAAVVRTAVQSIANDAALEVYKENEDVIKGLEYVATLDSRVTPQCAALDGQRWKLDGTKMKGTKLPFRRPPIHWSCRSTLLPITSLSDVETGTRSSINGPISSKINFEKFMDKQGPAFAAEILGKGRYEFYKKNKLTLSQLIDPRSLEPLTLAELREKF